MGCAQEIETEGATAVVVRRATGTDDASRLRATAERLAAAAHPGVVEVLGSHGDETSWELRLVYAGRTLDAAGRLTPEQVAALAAAVAATLGDLHAAGIVHGDLDSSHVLLGSHSRPVLCGFGPHPRSGAGPEDDVAALGALMVTLLGTEADLEPLPTGRWRRGDGQSWVRRSLLLLADHASAEPATRRPSAARLAAAIAEAVPTSPAAPSPAAPSSVSGSVGRLPGRGRVLAASGVAVLVLGGVGWHSSRPAAVSQVPGVLPTTVLPTTVVPTTVVPTTTTAPPVLVAPTITFEGRRYELGRPGDLAVLGDWDGDETPTPALLRPTTGEVFVFPRWTTAADLVVEAAATVTGAEALVVVRGDRRDVLVVRRADGSEWTMV